MLVRGLKCQRFPIFPPLWLTLNHQSHGPEKQASLDFLNFHGRILAPSRTIIQTLFPVVREFGGESWRWLTCGVDVKRAEEGFSSRR